MPNTESIRRIRAKLQEDKPSLRGHKYNYRRRFEKDYVQNLNNVMHKKHSDMIKYAEQKDVEVANDC